MKFIIENDGDSSVGIRAMQFEVEVKGIDDLDNAWKENFIEYFKKDLAEYFELETRCTVYTEEEYATK